MSRRVRIAYLVPPSKQFAGIERAVHEIANGLQSMYGDAVDVHVIFCTSYTDDALAGSAYTTHVLGVDRLLRIPAVLRRILKREKFDLLICPQVEASVIGWLTSRWIGLPVFVSHLHGNPDLEERDGTWRTKASFVAYRGLLIRSMDAILAVSPSLADYARAELAGNVPVYFAENPIRDFHAPQRPPRKAGRPFEFVSVGRLSVQKGQDVLLRALAMARADLPPVRLRLIGSGPMDAEWRALSSELGLDDVVEFTGYVSDPAPALLESDCFVLASRWEGFGGALVEALQFGLPLLATDCRFGPSDIIDSPRLGEVVAADDAAALAAGLTRAINAPYEAADDAYRRESATKFLPEAATASHYQILSRILRDRGTARAATLPGG